MNARAAAPPAQAAFLDGALPRLAADVRIVGVAAAGSYVSGTLDEFSDLDLVIAVEPASYDAVLADRQAIAAGLGDLLVGFTGEHVGEPRLLICLYASPLLHVDLKFVRVADAAERVEDPVVLWERDGRLTAALATRGGRFPPPDPQWIEDRIWTWVHYVASKIGRGELLEAVDGLAFIRGLALGPLALAAAGARPMGVRRIEQATPELAADFARTVAPYDAAGCVAALEAAIALYRRLRDAAALPQLRRHARAESEAVAYVRRIAVRIAAS